MAFHNTAFWEIVLNIIAFFACLVVIWGLIRLKRKTGGEPAPAAADDAPAVFNDVVRDELARQTSPDPFPDPFPDSPPDAPSDASPIVEERSVHIPAPPAAEEIAEPSDDMYETAKRLAARGLTPEEIMARVSLPRSEIDLIMKLKEYGS